MQRHEEQRRSRLTADCVVFDPCEIYDHTVFMGFTKCLPSEPRGAFFHIVPALPRLQLDNSSGVV